jgi:hypothetical protein
MATNPKDLTDEELFDEIERRLGSRRSFKACIDRIARALPGKPRLEVERAVKRSLAQSRGPTARVERRLKHPGRVALPRGSSSSTRSG